MAYVKLVITVPDDYQEALIAELAEMEFEGFEQGDGYVAAYIEQKLLSDVYREQIEMLLMAYPGEGHVESEEVLEDQNWNEQWEASIQPQHIGTFFIKPTWSTAGTPEDSILLEIDPKMSFGTGYHETTRLMLHLIPEVIKPGAEVLDAGTGTGVLSIASIKCGASYALGYDIDEWSYNNARENIYLNGTGESIEILQGTDAVIPAGKQFDVVLANINRNIIIDQFEGWLNHIKPGGDLVLSGLMINDQESIERLAGNHHLTPYRITREAEWIAMWFKC